MFTSIKNMNLGLAVMGYIKIGKKGEMKKSVNNTEFRLPKKLDHFEIVSREVDSTSDNFKTDTEMMEKLGEKPTELDVMLQYDEIELNCPYFLAAYQGSKLYCHGNGESALREGREIACNPKTCSVYLKQENKIQCKPQGKLYVVLLQKDVVGGVYAFKTTSWESIRNIVSSMMRISKLSGGILSGLELKLKLIPTRDQTPTGTTTNYKAALLYPGSIRALRQAALEERSLREVSTLDRKAEAALWRAEIEQSITAPEEAAETVAEFYPHAAGIDEQGPVNHGIETVTMDSKEKKAPASKPAVSVTPAAKQASVKTESPAKTEPPVQVVALPVETLVEKPAVVPPVPENPNRIHLSGDIDMDISGLFTKLNFSPARQKGQMEFNKDKKPTLLANLIVQAGTKGFEVIAQAAKAK